MKNMILFVGFLLYLTGYSEESVEEQVVKADLVIFCDPILEGRYEGMKEEESVKVQFVGVDGSNQSVNVGIGNVNTRCRYEGLPLLNFYGEGPIEKANLMGSCQLNPEWKKIAILMIPIAQKRFLIHPVDIGGDSIPSGFAKITNFSDEILGSMVAGEKVVTEPGKFNLVSLSKIKKYQFSILHSVQKKENDKMPRIVYSRKVSARATDKILIFTYKKFGASGAWRSKIIRNP